MDIDLAALRRQLEGDPARRVALRRVLLGDGADLEGALGVLAEAQQQSDRRLAVLTEQVGALAEAQRRTEERVDELAKELRELAVSVRSLGDAVHALVDTVRGMHTRVARVEGDALERRYRDKGHAYFAPIALRLRLVDGGELGALVADAREAGTLHTHEADSLLWADAVFSGQGRQDGTPVHLVVEASVTVDHGDVRRARERADLLAKVVQTPVIPVVAGEFIPSGVAQDAQDSLVWQVSDGRVVAPTDEPAA